MLSFITIPAQDLEVCGPGSPNAVVGSCSSPWVRTPLCRPVVVDVVDSQKLDTSFPAADTAPPIMRHNLLLQSQVAGLILGRGCVKVFLAIVASGKRILRTLDAAPLGDSPLTVFTLVGSGSGHTLV